MNCGWKWIPRLSIKTGKLHSCWYSSGVLQSLAWLDQSNRPSSNIFFVKRNLRVNLAAKSVGSGTTRTPFGWVSSYRRTRQAIMPSLVCWSVPQNIRVYSQPTNQSTNQLTNQPTNQPTNQSTNQPTNTTNQHNQPPIQETPHTNTRCLSHQHNSWSSQPQNS